MEISLIYVLIELAGILLAVHALLYTRTSQGALAWIISLIFLPVIAIPLYAVFGRRKFKGYIESREQGDNALYPIAESLNQASAPFHSSASLHSLDVVVLEKLARLHFTHSNDAQLLINGEATFATIFDDIAQARDYILIQFYIVRDDELGQRLKHLLIGKAREGVKVYFLYDEIGSHDLSQHYIDSLRQAGVEIHSFNDAPITHNRFQINFRNHRKTTIIDGRIGHTGGLNVGNEYLGLDPRYREWRDTHCRFTGPCVQALQLTFLEDWYWVTQSIPPLNWQPQPSGTADKNILVLPTGPADTIETGTLYFMHTINTAKKRLWIASPYFVPDLQILSALELAFLRGVDIRILLPGDTDNPLIHLSGYANMVDACHIGMKVYRYPGFSHQKVLLVDDNMTAIGTANLGNRSFRLNFETTMVVIDEAFNRQTEKMLLDDMAKSDILSVNDIRSSALFTRIIRRLARLMAPLQ